MENKNHLLLIVEDDKRLLLSLKMEFEDRGYTVETASSLEEVKQLKLDSLLRFATVDLRLKSESGLPVVEYLKQLYPKCRIIVLTGYGSIASAVDATKKGAVQFITKPVQIDKLERLLWTDEAFAEAPELEIESLARHEREYIEWVLVQTQGNISEAAKKAGNP